MDLMIKYKYSGTVIIGKVTAENFCSFVSGLFCKIFFVDIVEAIEIIKNISNTAIIVSKIQQITISSITVGG